MSFGKKSAPVDNSAAIQAQQLETSKATARANLNNVFDNPGALAARNQRYDRTASAARELNTTYLNEDRDKARGQTKLNLMRSGLFGGSADIQANSDINRRYTAGLTDIGSQSDGLRRSLVAADEESRADLLDKIDGGMDGMNAVSLGAQRMRNAASGEIAASRGRMVGDLFSGVADAYGNHQYRQGQQAGGGQIPMPAGYAPIPSQRTRRIFGT